MSPRRDLLATLAALAATMLLIGGVVGFLVAGWVAQADGPDTATCHRSDGGFACVEVDGERTWTRDPAEPAPLIMEDDPRWDCRTMGNRRCGPGATLPGGEPATP